MSPGSKSHSPGAAQALRPARQVRRPCARRSGPARFPRQPHAARRVSRVTRRRRRPGARIPEPEPRWSAAGRVRRERRGALRPCAGTPRASGRHRSPAPGCGHRPPRAQPWAFTLSFPVGVAATVTGRRGGKASQLLQRSQVDARRAGRWRLLGSASSAASNLLCDLRNPSPAWVSEMGTAPRRVAFTK